MKLNENYINVPSYDEFEYKVLEDEQMTISQEEAQEKPVFDMDLVSKCEAEVNRKLAIIQKIWTGPKVEGVSDTFIGLAMHNMIDVMYERIKKSGKEDFNSFLRRTFSCTKLAFTSSK